MELIDFSSRILVSLLLGMLIGFERQLTGHPAGIRTNMLICLGSCMFLLFPMIMQSNDIQRVASYIVSGVGFLCSGVIFKENGTVKGLNTAATLWCSASIGILCSSGKYLYALIATIILLISNILFRPLSKKISPLESFNEETNNYKISLICENKKTKKIKNFIIEILKNKKTLLIELNDYKMNNKNTQIDIIIKLMVKDISIINEEIIDKIVLNNDIKKIWWGNI